MPHAPIPSASDRVRHQEEVAGGDVAALRLHLEDDHDATLYDDDDDSELPNLHVDLHRVTITEPAPPAAPEVSPAVEEARAEVELYRLKQAEASYDVAMPTTLRERMSYARSLAASGLIPKAFRSARGGAEGLQETTANILLAVELGNTLGLSPLQALCQVNVVEGKPGLGAEGQLAQVLKAGHDAYVDEERSDRTRATVVAQRAGSERVHTITYSLDDALAAGLCRLVDGKPVARSERGKPLPWETSTPDMLVWRAVTRTCKRVFPDVVGGLAVVEDDPGTQYAQAARTTTAAQEVPARATAAKAPDTDSVEDDLALFTDTTGPWWSHAGAKVRRRSKLQLAADRLMDAREAGDDRVPYDAELQVPDVVDAEVVDEGLTDTEVEADLQAELARAALATEAAQDAVYEANLGTVADPSPGELPTAAPAVPAEPVDTSPASDPWAAPPSKATLAAVPDAPVALDRAQLWDAVEALAAERGKSTAQLLARHTLATRTNPEDMSADQLQTFLAAQRGL